MYKLRASPAYLIATLISLSTLALIWSLPIADRQISLVLLMGAVVVNAWICGWRAGLLATAICASGNVVMHIFSGYDLVSESIRLTAFLSLALLILTITVLRQVAEDALSESETQLRAILDHSRDPIAVTLDGVHQFVNRAYLRMFGYDSAEELVGTCVLDVIAPDDRESILKRIENRAYGRSNPDHYEARGLRRDGSHVDLEIHVSSYRQGEQELVLVILRDITDRKRAFQEKESLIAELREALSKVKQLHGLLPTCSSCRQIRDDDGKWHDMENYICEHSEANFSHGLCPTCAEKLYPEVFGPSSKKGRHARALTLRRRP